MAGLFDDIGSAPSGGGLFDDIPAPTATKASAIDRANQFAPGINEGLANTIGAPVDFANWLMGKVGLGSKEPFGGSGTVKKAMGLVGANPDNVPVTDDMISKVVRGAGEGVGSTVGPGMEVAALDAAGAIGRRAMPMVESIFGRTDTLPEAAKLAGIGAAGGAGGEGLADALPEKYQGIGRLTGNILGGGLGAGAMELPAVGKAGWNAAKDYIAPLTEGGRQRLAGETIRESASDSNAVRNALDNVPDDIVPGSRPTTFQATGDMGLGSLERWAATRSPEDFNARRGEQNAARLDTFEGIQPTGAPASLSQSLRDNLSAIDRDTDAAVNRVTDEARQAAGAIPGGGLSAPEAGLNIRTALTDAETTARAHERALWDAVDPDGTLTVPMTSVRAAVGRLYGNLSRAASANLSPAETALRGVVDEYGPVESFRELADLRSMVSTAMREEMLRSGRTPTYARLSNVRGVLENVITRAANSAPGRPAIIDRVNAWRDGLARVAQEHANDPYIGQAVGNGSVNAAPMATTVMPAAPGAGRTGGTGPGTPAGAQGVPGVVPPTFDAAAASRVRAATAATRDRAQTFGAGPVKAALKRSGQEGPYALPDALVPSKFFVPGPRGADGVATFHRAVNGDPQAMNALRDYAVSDLRRVAERPDGTMDPARVAAWRDKHEEALHAFPELDRQLADAGRASQAIEDVASVRRSAMDDFQKSAAGKVMGATTGEDTVKAVASILGGKNSVADMARLAAETRNNPAAREGLRRSVIDVMMNKTLSTAESGTTGRNLIKSDAFQKFIAQNEAALRHIFTPNELKSMRDVAADLKRANRSIVSTKIPGQSNTAQDLTAVGAKHGVGGTILAHLLHAAAGAGAGSALGPIGSTLGAAVGVIGGAAVSNLRNKGLQTVDQLVSEAMLNPTLARTLLAKVPPKGMTKAAQQSFTQRIRRLAISGALQTADH